MGNTASNYEAKKKLKYNRSRMNSMNSLDTVTSKYSINNLVNRLKQSSSSRKSSNRSSIKSNTTNPLVGYTSQVDAHSQATLIADEMKNFHSSELVLKELFQAPETSPEKRRDRDR
jgi:hypothetical protein